MNGIPGVALIAAALLSLLGTRLARAAAHRFEWFDRPSQRKMHINPIPLLGGVAIYNAFVLSFLMTNTREVLSQGVVVLIGSTLLVLIGFYDDQRGLGPRPKLLAQVIAAALLVVGDIHVALFTNYWLNFGLTVFWVVGICNAMNLLDNMDGLSAGIAAIASLFFTLLAVSQGQIWVSAVAASLLGATLGFLRYNWNPATIFMGDAGSLLLGYLLAVLAIKLRFPNDSLTRTWMIPILVLAVPIADTALVTVSRLRRGVPISSGGKDHASHRLVRLGLSVRQAVTIIYLAAIVAGATALLVALVPSTRLAYAVTALLSLCGLVILYFLERVDLADTGQVARPPRRSPSARRRSIFPNNPTRLGIAAHPRDSTASSASQRDARSTSRGSVRD